MSKHIQTSKAKPEKSPKFENFKRRQRRKRRRALAAVTFDWAAGRPTTQVQQ